MTKPTALVLLLALLFAAPSPARPAPAAPPAAGPAVAASPAPAPLDLNRATREELVALPGIGPATADAILARRDAGGPFSSVDQLLEVKGIGEKRLAELRTLLAVTPPPPRRAAAPPQ